MKFISLKFTICFLFISFFSFAQNANGLVARYTFNDGNTKDDMGNSPAKAVGVSFGEDRFGNPRSACLLTGSNKSYLNLGTNSLLKPSEGSISLWIKMLDEVHTGRGYEGNPVVLTKSHAGDDYYEAYYIGYDLRNKKILLTSSESDINQILVFGTDPFKLDEWHHIVMTYSNKSVCLYIDGTLQNCVDKNFPTHFLETDSVMVGNTANLKNNRFFSGYVDDICIYNRVLSADEVAQLFNEANPSRYRSLFIIILFSLIGITVITFLFVRKYRRALEKEKEKNKIQRQMYEMEMKVIKAQMNPHFIFNSMNSIQQFILSNDTENANTYLVKFARLLRKIMESTTDEYISVENEIDILKKYIEIESLRFAHAFSYEIIVDDRLKGSPIRIPQMLIQPFVENAIWHGLLLKEGNKNLKVTFNYIDKMSLSCIIDDNGIGRNAVKKQQIISKEKSLGIHFTSQRLELMRKEWNGDYGIEITDKLDEKGNVAGTQVKINIPIIQN